MSTRRIAQERDEARTAPSTRPQSSVAAPANARRSAEPWGSTGPPEPYAGRFIGSLNTPAALVNLVSALPTRDPQDWPRWPFSRSWVESVVYRAGVSRHLAAGVTRRQAIARTAAYFGVSADRVKGTLDRIDGITRGI